MMSNCPRMWKKFCAFHGGSFHLSKAMILLYEEVTTLGQWHTTRHCRPTLSVVILTMTCRVSQALRRYTNVCIIITFLPWYFIPRVLILAKAKMYVRNGCDRNSDTVKRVGKAHCIETLNCHWNTLVYRNVASRGSAVQSVALLPISVMMPWASSDQGSLPPPEKKYVTSGERIVLGRLSRRLGRCGLPACSSFCDT